MINDFNTASSASAAATADVAAHTHTHSLGNFSIYFLGKESEENEENESSLYYLESSFRVCVLVVSGVSRHRSHANSYMYS